MKNIFSFFWTIIVITVPAISSFGQHEIDMPMEQERIEPFRMEVTYEKTSHLIFPSAIRYVDLGSEFLTAGKADDAENVLRVKAAVKDFEPETNFSVITNDGRFYSFDVNYSPNPISLSYNLQTMQKEEDRKAVKGVLFEELGSTVSLIELIMQSITKSDKRLAKHISSKSYGIQFTLKGIYIMEGKYYFHTQLSNSTNVPFEIDYVKFKITDKNKSGRTVLQEKSISPLRMHKPLDLIAGKETGQNVFLLDQFTLADDKLLLIEVYEKNGGRYQILKVKNSDLIRASLIRDIHLKF